MSKKFKLFPAPLRTQLAIRFLLGIAFFAGFLCILIFIRDLILSFPCLVVSVFLLVNCYVIYYRAARNKYIAVSGVCADIECTHIRKQVKYIYLQAGEMTVRFPVRKRIKRLVVGDVITLYLPESARIYEKGEDLVVFDYYAFEINGGEKNDAGKSGQKN